MVDEGSVNQKPAGELFSVRATCPSKQFCDSTSIKNEVLPETGTVTGAVGEEDGDTCKL
jgi:hypothetical protein